MNVLKKIVFVLLGIIVLAVVVSFFLPSKMHVERTAEINAPVDQVYQQVAVLKNNEKWSPWKEKDPSAVNTYEGPETGVGSKMMWKGDPKLSGEGSQTVTVLEPNKTIQHELVFKGRGKAQDNWAFEATPNGTKVVWSFDNDLGMNPIARIMMAVMSMDKMLGPDLEKGLSNLKNVSESMAKASPADNSKTQTATMGEAPAK